MSFAKDIEKWAKKAGLAADRVPTVVCMKLTERIVEDSPVDTGRFKGNWQATIGSPASGTLETLDKSGAATLAKANAIAQNAGGNVFYLVNNLPYARVLEYGLYGTGAGATVKTTRDGYSVQAPYGMVRINVQRFKETVAEAAREVRK